MCKGIYRISCKTANNVITQPMFDIDSVGLAARAGDNIDDETINEAKRQVQAFYEKKN